MHWDDMRIFLALARAESLTAAGRALRMDPGTVGRRVARLEEDLGQTLFARSPQGYALTDLGARMREHAALAEAALAAAVEEGQGAAGLTGAIRIGAPDGCANFLLPQVVARIADENPGLDIQILALPRVVNLSRREADMAITVSPPRTGRLTVQKITDYRLHLAAHRDLGPEPDLSALPLVGYIPDMIFDAELDYLGGLNLEDRETGNQAPGDRTPPDQAAGAGSGAGSGDGSPGDPGRDRVPRASNSASVQLHLLRQGGAVGIVHDFALPFAPELHRVLTGRVSLRRAFYLVRHAADRRSDRLDRFARALLSGLRAEVARLEAAA